MGDFGWFYTSSKNNEIIKHGKVNKHFGGNKIIYYSYIRMINSLYYLRRFKTIYLIKSKFSQQELDFIDELFNNLDESNLTIIKGIINGRMAK